MKNKHFVVFLDVDGVLNSKTTVQRHRKAIGASTMPG